MGKYITELIGTFFLVLTIGLTGNPLAIGAVLMVMIYMGGHISGAHYNPAVTLAILIRKKIEPTDAIAYVVAQLVGAVLAALTVNWFTDASFSVAPGSPDPDTMMVVAAEILFTFALCFVILNVATHPKTEGNSYYGLAIGFTVFAGAMAVGAISGGAFNPAVGLGPNIVDMFDALSIGDTLVYYLVAPLAGGVIAGFAYRLINPDQFQS